MEMDGFQEIINIIYVAKQLYDMDKYELVQEHFFDSLDYDNYFENMYSLVTGVSELYDCGSKEEENLEIQVHSSRCLVDFYDLAIEYGKRNKISKKNNKYIECAEKEAAGLFNFSYCLDWKLVCNQKTKYPLRSRLILFYSLDDYVDYARVALGLIELYGWFESKGEELRKILGYTEQEAIAA